jgi:hypothetical protein
VEDLFPETLAWIMIRKYYLYKAIIQRSTIKRSVILEQEVMNVS